MSWAGSEYSEEYYPPEALEKPRLAYVQPKVGPFDLIKVKNHKPTLQEFEQESKVDHSDDDEYSNDETKEEVGRKFSFTPAIVLKQAKILKTRSE